jgi:hypothetical protein
MTRVVPEYVYTCNGCGKTERIASDSYPANWMAADDEDFDDDGEDYCAACQAKRQP